MTAATLLVAAHGAPSAADPARPLGVVELYTSQGCSSCPPADAMLSDMADRGDVVALAFHVDYWDYLGWRDTLASPANTERQRAYGRAFDSGSVYTPQAIVNGRVHLSGAKPASIAETLVRLDAEGQGLLVGIDASWSGESILIDIGSGDTEIRKAHVLIAYFDPLRTVEIARGENKGRSLTYRNSVTSLQTVGMWHGKPAQLEVPIADRVGRGGKGCAILLQKIMRDGRPGPIIGAALVPSPSS